MCDEQGVCKALSRPLVCRSIALVSLLIEAVRTHNSDTPLRSLKDVARRLRLESRLLTPKLLYNQQIKAALKPICLTDDLSWASSLGLLNRVMQWMTSITDKTTILFSDSKSTTKPFDRYDAYVVKPNDPDIMYVYSEAQRVDFLVDCSNHGLSKIMTVMGWGPERKLDVICRRCFFFEENLASAHVILTQRTLAVVWRRARTKIANTRCFCISENHLRTTL